MDELTDDDKTIVYRARRIQRFLSQPFFVAEAFTGTPGKFVRRQDTVKGFKMLIEGKLDEIPESCFYMRGSVDEVIEEGERVKKAG